MEEQNSGTPAMNETQEQPQEVLQDPAETQTKPEDQEPRKKTGYDRLKEKYQRLQSEVEELKAKSTPKETQAASSEKPRLDDFESWDAYIEATAEWKVTQKLTEREAKEKEQTLKAEKQAKQQTYAQKAQEFAKSTPDFLETLEESDAPMNDTLHQAIVDSDLGPQVAYYLAKNPEEAAKMVKMGYGEMNRYLGKLETKLSTKSTEVKTTRAPEPITPIRNAAPKSNRLEDASSYEVYAALRRQKPN